MDLDQLSIRLSGRVPEPVDIRARYAVLVPLAELEGELHLLYEVRAATLRRQPREVCFPGGRMEAGEDAVQCALRETREELGIPRDRIRVLGQLDYLYTRAHAALYPILARIDAGAARSLAPSPAEVDEAFFVPVEALRRMTPVSYSYDLIPNVPADFPYELVGIPERYPWQRGSETGWIYPWQGKAIWGMTGRLTRYVLELLQ